MTFRHIAVFIAGLSVCSADLSADSITLPDGKTIQGKVTAYDAKEKVVTIREKRGRGESADRQFKASEYHSITIDGDAEKLPPAVVIQQPLPDKPVLAKDVIEWGKSATHGRLKAKIHKVVVERAPLRFRSGKEQTGWANDPDLIIYWTITNTDERRNLGYEHNVLDQKGEAHLFDDIGQHIRGMSYGIYQHTQALKDVDDIAPGQTKWHITTHSIPPPKTKALTAKLDLAPFGIGRRGLTGGGDTFLTFEIPLSKIENYPRR